MSVLAACRRPAALSRDSSSLSLGSQMWLMSWQHLYIYFSFSWVGFSTEGSEYVCPKGAESGRSLQSGGGRCRVVLSDPCDS